MTEQPRYDVAIVGIRPGVAHRGQPVRPTGLDVVVIERDPDIYCARAISTDEEVLRIWQQVGSADRLNADMQPGAYANLPTRRRLIIRLLPADRGNGHPPQQFIYQPAVDRPARGGRPLRKRLILPPRARMPAAGSASPTASS